MNRQEEGVTDNTEAKNVKLEDLISQFTSDVDDRFDHLMESIPEHKWAGFRDDPEFRSDMGEPEHYVAEMEIRRIVKLRRSWHKLERR